MPERAIDGDGREVTSGFGSSNLWLTRCWSKGDSKSRSHPECGTLAPLCRCLPSNDGPAVCASSLLC
jgi:hypothetical protein